MQAIAVVILATALAVPRFAHDFAGSWACAIHLLATPTKTAQTYPESMTIAQLPQSRWSTVTWSSPTSGGTAVVGTFGGSPTWVYDDYWNDGHLYRDLAHEPGTDGTWLWYDAPDQIHMDKEDGPQTWRRTSQRTISIGFFATHGGRRTSLGSESCHTR